MTDNKLPLRLIAGICVVLFFGVALYFRMVLPHDNIFLDNWTKFTATDPWYHMRIVDTLVHNFPHWNTIDPYLLHPVPMALGAGNFFDYLLAAIIWLAGWGSPAPHTVDAIGAYFPAIIGALVVIPAYFMGKAVINRWAGVIAAGLIAFSPGEFLGRSLLGYPDHHGFEILCSTVAMLFIILAVQNARQQQLSVSHLRKRQWSIVMKPLVYSLLAGIALGIYLNSWLGALLFIFILFACVIIQFIIDYGKGIDSGYLCFTGSITFLVTLIIVAVTSRVNLQIAALLIALMATVLLYYLSRLMTKHKIKTAYYPLVILGLGLVSLAMLFIVNVELLYAMAAQFSVLLPAGARLTIMESEPMLFPGGVFSFMTMWVNFTTGSILALVCLGIFIYHVIKKGEPDKLLLVVWSLIILIITLSMRRFAYYFAVNVAVLGGCAAWLLLKFFGFREELAVSPAMPQEMVKKARQKKVKKKAAGTGSATAIRVLGVIVVFFLAIFPNIGYARDRASLDLAPGQAWFESLDWLRNNTPEPYGNPDFYYALYRAPFAQPASAYSVAAHWDFGYWITRLGRRPPITNPGIFEGRELVARYFLAQDEESAAAFARAKGVKYVVVEHDTALAPIKYHTWVEYAGVVKSEYYDFFVLRRDGKTSEIVLYYPPYYRSLGTRLYNFNGERVTGGEATVISYQDRIGGDGVPYKEITSWKPFSNYAEALAYVQLQKSDKFKIVGTDPFVSPVSLDSLKHYKLVYSSRKSIAHPNAGRVSEVKVFQCLLPTAP